MPTGWLTVRTAWATAILMVAVACTAPAGQDLSLSDISRPSSTLAQPPQTTSRAGTPPTSATFQGSRDEWNEAVVDCLQREGWPAEVSDDGGGFEIATVNAQNLAVYKGAEQRCFDKIGMPEYAALDDLEFASRFYDALLESRECLLGLGFDVAPPPTREVFLETWDTGPWTPYADVPDARWGEAIGQCPQPVVDVSPGDQ